MLFKKHRGMGVFEWLRLERLNRAQYLLRHTDQPIQTIALTLGFTDAAHFSKRYKKQFAVTPKMERKMTQIQ